MARYTDFYGTQWDFDLDDPDPFREKREQRSAERSWEYRSNRSDQDDEDYTGDWDD